MVSPPGFVIVPEESASNLTLRFKGVADMSSIAPLDDYLRAAHMEAMQTRVQTVVVDFRALEFMNSSCFKCFIAWITEIQGIPREAQYPIHFEANSKLPWQRRSLKSLQCFALDLITVDER
jgi:hypothetical protein